ncbi:hypothetical protein [Actinomadura parmotrematis]|uniref:Secreted protein n=1 Tax=Actinomadura parmotrematis TaxID=2864039 RepID=A0ABS7G5J5_9ACTN|nr:hypothetical protein [Actinomadura parmotrematis]MBW8487149.1 hypothetical protein [Actinomadura parmotrematis]
MRAAARAGLMTGAALPGLLLAVPAAHADDLDIDPYTVRPDQNVTVSGGCQAGDRYVSVSGAASGQGNVNDGWFSIQARVNRSKAGTYTITAKCITSGYSQDGTVKVTTKKSSSDDDDPSGGAATGGGGAADIGGPEAPWAPVGGALLAGGVGIGAVVLVRQRARGRG